MWLGSSDSVTFSSLVSKAFQRFLLIDIKGIIIKIYFGMGGSGVVLPKAVSKLRSIK